MPFSLSAPDIRRLAIRSTPNPMDKCTIVSIIPKEIREIKPTVQPGVFYLAPGSYENPSILVVGPSSWWREIDEHQPLLEISNSSIQIADSIVRDYCSGLLGCNMNDKMPGLFYVQGEKTVADIKKDYKGLLDEALKKQKAWYGELVMIADSLWARTNGDAKAITDDARTAALDLNISNKEWIKDFHVKELIRCVACGSLKNPEFPICPNCKAITDTKKAESLGIRFAQ